MLRAGQVLIIVLLQVLPAVSMAFDPFALPGSVPQTLRWRSSVVRIALSTSLSEANSSIKADSDVISAVRRSILAWGAETGLDIRLEPTDRQSVSPTGVTGDGVSVITIAQTPENVQLFARDPFSESAITRVFYDRRGTISEADIVLNPFQQFSTDGTYGTFDLETTITHEVGHLLGLRHSAVSGSVMAERIPRNGDDYAGPRTPSAVDLAGLRELYSFESETCCGAVTGRLIIAGRPVKGFLVWAEDKDGRVISQAEVTAEGTYRLGGLPDGEYALLTSRRSRNGSAVTNLGPVRIQDHSREVVSKRLDDSSGTLMVDGLGFSPDALEPAVTMRSGRTYTLYLGGKDVERLMAVSSYSKWVRVDLVRSADGRPVLNTSVDRDAPAGLYTIYLTGSSGERSALVGTISVQH